MYHGVTRNGAAARASLDESSAAPPDDVSTSATRVRKERVLHTRIPAALEDELKRVAGTLRIPLSNLVRSIIEEALSKGGSRREGAGVDASPGPLDRFVAFQQVTMARQSACGQCRRELPPGASAHLGIAEGATSSPVFVCAECALDAAGGPVHSVF